MIHKQSKSTAAFYSLALVAPRVLGKSHTPQWSWAQSLVMSWATSTEIGTAEMPCRGVWHASDIWHQTKVGEPNVETDQTRSEI